MGGKRLRLQMKAMDMLNKFDPYILAVEKWTRRVIVIRQSEFLEMIRDCEPDRYIIISPGTQIETVIRYSEMLNADKSNSR